MAGHRTQQFEDRKSALSKKEVQIIVKKLGATLLAFKETKTIHRNINLSHIMIHYPGYVTEKDYEGLRTLSNQSKEELEEGLKQLVSERML